MKITVSKTELYNKLKTVGRIIQRTNTLPQCDYFMFNIVNNELEITGSDSSGIIRGKVNLVDIENPSSLSLKFLVDKPIMEAVKELSEQPIVIEIDEKTFHVKVCYKNGVFDGGFEMQGCSSDAFPAIVMDDEPISISLERSILLEGLKSALPFIANDTLRPVMNGVYIHSKDDKIIFVATDSNILSLREYPIAFPEFGTIIPGKTAKMITDIIGESKESQIKISISSKNISVITESYTLIYRLIEGRYPNYRGVIPKEFKSSSTVNISEIKSALSRVIVFANKNSILTTIDVNAGAIQINAQDIDYSTSAAETIFCEFDGDPVKIGFNGNKLIETLSAISSEECVIELTDPSRAAIIHPVGVEGVTLLIMPLTINN